jgi:hypothetical protein
MSILPHLSTGDNISFVFESGGSISYGRIIRRSEGRVAVTRYAIREPDNEDVDDGTDSDEFVSTIFTNIRELTSADDGELWIEENMLVGIIFVVPKRDLANNKYNVQGISNAFYNTDLIVDPFPFSVTSRILSNICQVQRAIYKILNRALIGQTLVRSDTVYLDTLCWKYLKEAISAGTSIQVIRKEISRTEKVYLPRLMKQSIRYTTPAELINIDTEEGFQRIKDIFGRFCFIGTRDKFPKGGEMARSIGYGTSLNVATSLNLKYISKYDSLYIKLKYEMRSAHNGMQL